MIRDFHIFGLVIVCGKIARGATELPGWNRFKHADLFVKAENFQEGVARLTGKNTGMPHRGAKGVLEFGESFVYRRQ